MGRIAGIILVLVLGAIACGCALLLPRMPWYIELSATMQHLAFAGSVVIVGLLLVLPAATIFDRNLRRLNELLEQASKGEPVNPPRMFGAVTSSFLQSLGAVLRRERSLSEDLRDLQLSHRILETEHEQLQGVLHALHDAVIVTDSFNEIITLNQAATEILGFTTETGGRRSIDSLISDTRLVQLIREARDAGEFRDSRIVEHEIEVDGERRPYQIALSALENNKGETGAVVTILHDLRREREIAQMKSDFVSKASHELRTPLSSIRAYVEMLVDGEAADEEARREFYSIIQNETERLGRMIDNMLNISRIEAGIIQIDRETVDFHSILQRAAETLEPQAREKNMTLTIKAAPVDLTAEGDADMLYQVVLNLLSNSIKYTPEGGRITLAADSDNLTRSIVVTVSDTGLGIPPDALPRLFEKFYRIESFKRVAKGTGLGLNLCRHIVETVHHGQIGVDSKLGMGSKFWFTIPMRFVGAAAA